MDACSKISYAGGVSGVDVVVTDTDPTLFYGSFE